MHTFALGSPTSITTLPAIPADVIGARCSNGSNHARVRRRMSRRRATRLVLACEPRLPIGWYSARYARLSLNGRISSRRVAGCATLHSPPVELDDRAGQKEPRSIPAPRAPRGRPTGRERCSRDRGRSRSNAKRSSSRNAGGPAHGNTCAASTHSMYCLARAIWLTRFSRASRCFTRTGSRTRSDTRSHPRTARFAGRMARARGARRDRRAERRSGSAPGPYRRRERSTSPRAARLRAR